MLVLVLVPVPVLALAPGPLPTPAIPPDTALVTPPHPPVANVVLVTVVGSCLEPVPSIATTSLLSTLTLHASRGMSPMHVKAAVNDPLTRMTTQGFHYHCVHAM